MHDVQTGQIMLSSTARATGSLVISWDICHTRPGFMPPGEHCDNLLKVNGNVPVNVHGGQATDAVPVHAAPQILRQRFRPLKARSAAHLVTGTGAR